MSNSSIAQKLTLIYNSINSIRNTIKSHDPSKGSGTIDTLADDVEDIASGGSTDLTELKNALAREGYDISSCTSLSEIEDIIDPYNGGESISWLNNPNNYLSFKFVEDGKFYWRTSSTSWIKSISYTKNNGTWTTIAATPGGYVCDVVAGDEIWVRGSENAYGSSGNYCSFFNIGKAYVSGSLASLKSGSMTDYCFRDLFYSCDINIDPEHPLVFPATTLASNCYSYMFEDCTSLTGAPALPTTTLANNCYYRMFYGCTSLTTAPALPATTLANYCYSYMFYGCTSLTVAPDELPATTLASSCYSSMFYGCKSLTTAPALPATTLASYCYSSMFYGCKSLTTAPALPATTLASNCYSYMFEDCTSLTGAPDELPATTLANYCYSSMFYGCKSLTTAPALPATTLASSCYSSMFYGCSNLNSVTCLATNISASSCVNYWLSNVASTGTFTKAASMTSWPRNTSGIPSGWTVQNYVEPQVVNNNYIKLTYVAQQGGG